MFFRVQIYNQRRKKQIITKIAAYKKCLTSVRETCSSKFYIGQHRKIGHKISVGRCKRLCSRDSKCQFVSYNSANYCFKYHSCDETDISTHIGDTYAKEGICPGISFILSFINCLKFVSLYLPFSKIFKSNLRK